MSIGSYLGISNPFGNKDPQNANQKAAKIRQGQNTGTLTPTVPLKDQDFPNGFQIFEITNGQIPTNPTVALLDNRKPKTSLPLGGEQHIVKDYYPGNSEPVMHILGPRESDIVIGGRLYDKKMAEGNYGASYAVMQVIDGIRLRGNLCKFVMGPILRYGFIEKTKFPLKRLGDIDYEITLSISGFNLPKNAYFTDNNAPPFEINQALFLATQVQLQKQVFTAERSVAQARVAANVPKSLLDDVTGAIGDVAAQITKVTGFVDSVFTAADNILKLANRMTGLIKNAQRAVSQYKRHLGALQLGVNQLGVGIGNNSRSSQAAGSHIAANFILHSISSANTFHKYLADMQARLDAIAKTTAIARVRVKQGDTLQKLSAHYYGNADLWPNIKRHNNLQTTDLTPGQVLELPKL